MTWGPALRPVHVLLSTFNGLPYLEPLLESVLAQDYPWIEIHARDDGSTDGTLALLRRYEHARPNVRVAAGDHIGIVSSFFSLLTDSDPRGGFTAFCDQDDLWKPNKLSRAVELLDRLPPGRPALYAGRLQLIDQSGRPLGCTELPRRSLGFRNALVESMMPGCTLVLNDIAQRLLLEVTPAHAVCHDWWAYLVISAFGNVIFDEEPRILYRVHGHNRFGATHGQWRPWLAKLAFFTENPDARAARRQAAEFRKVYGPMLDPSLAEVLDRFLLPRRTLSARGAYALSGNVYRQAWRDQLALTARILLDRL